MKNVHLIWVLIIGVLFGLGLVYSGMIYPSKVIGFLDIFGLWDPSLAFVMIGGIAVYSIGFLVYKPSRSLLGYDLQLPLSKAIDMKLVVGSALFGIGWGLAGFCPGPALTGLGFANPDALYFVLSMLAGMWIFAITNTIKK